MKKLLSVLLSLACLSSTTWAEPVRLRFIKDDAEALQVRVDMIRHAQREIMVEYFSVWNDDQSVGIIGLLIEAAQRGVKVKVLLDALSNSVPNAIISAMLRRGVDQSGNNNLEVKVYNPVSFKLTNAVSRTHAKLLITDGDLILTGGRNIGDKYFGFSENRNYDDLDALTEKSVAVAARENFMSVWNAPIVEIPNLVQYEADKLELGACLFVEAQSDCEAKRAVAIADIAREEKRIQVKLELILQAKGRSAEDVRNFDWFKAANLASQVEFVSHEPTTLVSRDTAQMTNVVLRALENAQKEAVLMSPYIIPTNDLFITIAKLLARGVNVKFLTNSVMSTDNVFAQAGYRKYRQVLIQMGVELYEYTGPNTMHLKGLVVDQRVSIVGSYNLDPRSAYVNREVGLLITEAPGVNPVATELLKIEKNLETKSALVAKLGKMLVVEEPLKDILSKKNSGLIRAISLILPLIENQL